MEEELQRSQASTHCSGRFLHFHCSLFFLWKSKLWEFLTFGIFIFFSFAYLRCCSPWAAVSFALQCSVQAPWMDVSTYEIKEKGWPPFLFPGPSPVCAFYLLNGLNLGLFWYGSTCEQVTLQTNFSRTTKHTVVMLFFFFFFLLLGKKKSCKYFLAFREQEIDCPQLMGCAECVRSLLVSNSTATS